MDRIFIYLVLAAAALAVVGCEESQKTSDNSLLEGVKITDLDPTFAPELPPEVHFRIYTFDIPADNRSLLADVFGILRIAPLRFTDKKAFRNNGFSAGFGQQAIWNRLGEELGKAGAVGKGQIAMMVFDEVGDELNVARVGQRISILYIGAENTITGAALSNGRLAWHINAQPLIAQRGAALVQLKPVFRRLTNTKIARLAGKKFDDELEFDPSAFEMIMGEGDFVLLGPNLDDINRINLEDMSLTLQGDFVDLEQDKKKDQKQQQEKKTTLGELFFNFEKDKPVIRISLIVCAGVRN